MFHKRGHSERVLFINTLLQRGVEMWRRNLNRFSGFRQGVETVEIETVFPLRPAQNTPLKRGVNAKVRSDHHLFCEMLKLGLSNQPNESLVPAKAERPAQRNR